MPAVGSDQTRVYSADGTVSTIGMDTAAVLSAFIAPPAQTTQLQPVQPVARGQQRVQGRADTLTSKEAAASATAVTFILSVCGLPAFVLIDSGSTHSIVSVEFASGLFDVLRSYDCEFVISTPVELDLCSRQCLIGCEVAVGGW